MQFSISQIAQIQMHKLILKCVDYRFTVCHFVKCTAESDGTPSNLYQTINNSNFTSCVPQNIFHVTLNAPIFKDVFHEW